MEPMKPLTETEKNDLRRTHTHTVDALALMAQLLDQLEKCPSEKTIAAMVDFTDYMQFTMRTLAAQLARIEDDRT